MFGAVFGVPGVFGSGFTDAFGSVRKRTNWYSDSCPFAFECVGLICVDIVKQQQDVVVNICLVYKHMCQVVAGKSGSGSFSPHPCSAERMFVCSASFQATYNVL